MLKPGVWVLVGRIAAAACTLLIVAATLRSAGNHTHPFSFCLYCAPRALSDALANIVLFAGLGASLRLAGLRLPAAIVLGAGTSAAVEIAQMFVAGRDPGISDLLSNTIGAAVGAAAIHRAGALVVPRPRMAERLALSAAALTWAAWWATGHLLTPSFLPRAYWGQWTPRLETLEPYRGRVLAANVGGQAIGDEPVADSVQLRTRLSNRDPVSVEVVSGPPTRGLSSIFSIVDDRSSRVLLVGLVRDDLVFRYRSKAADWRLDQPDIRGRGLLAHELVGSRFTIHIAPRGAGYCLTVGNREACGLGFGPGDGWGLLRYWGLGNESSRYALQILWVALVVAPSTFWARRRAVGALSAVVALTGLSVVPAASGLLATRPHEWLGAVAGLIAGAGFGWLARTALADRETPDGAVATDSCPI